MALQNKVAIITGGSAGIGAAIAECFAKEGGKVCITGRRQEQLDSVAKKCQELSGSGTDCVLSVTGDITKSETRAELIQKTIEKFGKLDILINNAGAVHATPMTEETEEKYDFLMDINLRTPVFLTKIAAPHLMASKGIVINMSSISGIRPGGAGVYSMSKGALDIYTRVLARELSPHGVRVNSVSPGFVSDTDILVRSVGHERADKFSEQIQASVPLGRNATPEDVVQSVLFLVTDKSSFITGHTLVLDGGMLTRPGF